MIINCENCNKKFNLDSNLVGEKGRLLKCSKCNHIWFFKIPVKLEKKIIIDNNKIEPHKNENPKINLYKDKKKIIDTTNKSNFNEKVKTTKKLNKDTKVNNNKILINSNNYVNYIVVILISLISLLLLIDTFKDYISIVFPSINIFLESLYQSLYDLLLFLKDLLS
tara:strand:- start:668 stop:1165 length:498 start_codon:yes stop_codon:yes gene_type:complete